MEDQGWIKLHRKLNESELWLLEPFTKGQAWVDLILNANHKDGSMDVRGNIVTIKRGQIGWSELTMASRWRWSRDKVRRFLRWLKTRQQIEQQTVFKITSIITIINYDQYQGDTTNKTTDDTTDRQQKDNRRYTNKNEKNEKNISKDIGDESHEYGNKDLISFKNWLIKNYPKPLLGVTDTRKLYNLKQVCSKRKNQDEWLDDEWKKNAVKFLKCYLESSESDEYLVNSIDKLKEKAKLWREYRGKLN